MENSRFDNFFLFSFKMIFICTLFVYRKNFYYFSDNSEMFFCDKQIKSFIFNMYVHRILPSHQFIYLYIHSMLKTNFENPQLETVSKIFKNFLMLSQVAGSTRHWERRDRQVGPKWVHAEKILQDLWLTLPLKVWKERK